MARGYLCLGCLADSEWLPPVFQIAISPSVKSINILPVAQQTLNIQAATYYQGAMRLAISHFKDREQLTVLPYLMHGIFELATWLAAYHLDDAVILPVPTTPDRLAERGFDPVSVLAVQLSGLTGIPLWHGVVRTGNQLHQRGLDRQSRLENLDGAFEVEILPETSKILLFDDVATTGATFKALASVLLEADPSLKIYGLCLAHGSASYV